MGISQAVPEPVDGVPGKSNVQLLGNTMMTVNTADRDCPLFEYSLDLPDEDCVATEGDIRLLMYEMIDGRSLQHLEQLELSLPGTKLSGPGLQTVVDAAVHVNCKMHTLRLVNCGLQGHRPTDLPWPDRPKHVTGDWDLLAYAIDPRRGSRLRELDISNNSELLFFSHAADQVHCLKEHNNQCISTTKKARHPPFFNMLFDMLTARLKAESHQEESIKLTSLVAKDIGMGNDTAEKVAKLLGDMSTDLRNFIGSKSPKSILSMDLKNNPNDGKKLAQVKKTVVKLSY